MQTKDCRLALFISLSIVSVAYFFATITSYAAGISQLDQWTSTTTPYSAITQGTWAKPIKITGITANLPLCVSSTGLATTTGCSSSGGLSFGKSWEIDAAGYLSPTTTISVLLNNGFVSQASSTVAGAFTVTGTTKIGSLTGLIKGASGTLSAATAGSDYENPLTFSWPLLRSTNAISWIGLATSSDISLSQALYATGANTFAGVATTSVSAGTGITLSGTAGALLGGSNLTIHGIGYPFPLNATTTAITFTNGASIAKLTNLTSDGFVKTSGGDGTLSVDTTTYESGLTAGDGLTRTTNDFDCDTASGSVFGCLASADWTTFNNKAGFAYLFPSNATSTLLTFSGGASTTALSTHTLAVGATATTTLGSDGKIIGQDTTNSWSGRISPTKRLILPFATTTATWTGTSTAGVDAAPATVAGFAGTIRSIVCTANTFLGVVIKIGSTAIAPSYFIASSTPGTITVTGSNTFIATDAIGITAGTTTSATAASGVVNGSCTIFTTET